METINKLKHLIYALVILIGILAYWQVNRYNRYQYVVKGTKQYAIDKKTHLVYSLEKSLDPNALGDWQAEFRSFPPKEGELNFSFLDKGVPSWRWKLMTIYKLDEEH